ncbi:MAG: DotI/IcmL/TraM family protein [Alphaproteobacteria bacterium]|nr:DotI/IcmL/TraM family protein [Alphaproteobacteria bacterium]
MTAAVSGTASPPAKPPEQKPRRAAGTTAEAIFKFRKLKRRITQQMWIIGALCLALALLLPFTSPVDLYYAVTPKKEVRHLIGLPFPNMTSRAVLAWATTSITEVMTMGFGDMDVRLPQQRWRFTPKGWEAYMTSFQKMEIGKTFKQNQLVLTTVPSNSPVILRQGASLDGVYQWIVQMPIIMTYATNNNVMRRERAVVTLTIARVPSSQSFYGIAIKSWSLH